jgi:hypothetical protein
MPPALEHVLEFEARVHALAGRQRDRGRFGQARIVFGLLGQHRLLDEQRAVGLQRAQQHLGHRRGHAAVEVDAEFDRLPKASRISAMRPPPRRPRAALSSMPSSSVPFILKVSKPASRSLRMPSITSAGRSPPTQL